MAQLSAQQERYAGAQITTSGRVQAFTDSGGTYYVLTDEAENRVALAPTEDAAGYSGKQVTVTGRFDFSPEQGRRIQIDTIRATEGSGPEDDEMPGELDAGKLSREVVGV